MIIGIGTDIVEVKRIDKSIQKSHFIEKVYSKHEINYCEKKKNSADSYAARFAAKEAFLKALGKGWREGLAFNEIEILNDNFGKPSLNILGKSSIICSKMKIKFIHVSMSHTKNLATATVILEG